jgi:hypothetical protein
MRRLAALTIVLLLAAAARGQSAATSDSLQGKLARLAVASEDLQQHLPSFTCKETLVSQEVRGGKVKMEVRAAGELRVLRDPTGKLNERFQATERNGKPIRPDKLRLPIFVSGGFKNALDFVHADTQACFHFSMTGNRMEFESGSEASRPVCANHTETSGFALLNDNGDISHLELRVPEDLARQRHSVPFGSIDLSRIELGGKSFLLSTHVVADMEKFTYHWEATYSECRLFSVGVTIGPATPVDTDNHGSGAGSGPTNP